MTVKVPRARRSELARQTLAYLSTLVEEMIHNTDGIYCIGKTDDEHDLVRATTLRVADSLRARAAAIRVRRRRFSR